MVKKLATAFATLTALASSQAIAEIRVKEFPRGMEPSCGLDAWEEFVGEPYSDVPEDVIESAESLRVIRPGTMITMDARMDRLNVYLDEDEIITRVRCG